MVGHGAMGTVFRARHRDLGREVALKVVNPRLAASDPVMLKRFVREVRLLRQVEDPHVVRILDAGQEGRFAFAVMELIVGRSLKRILDEEPEARMAPDAAAFYLAQIARGLEAVHQAGIIHRDLKPENVMVTTAGRAVIADFGLARGQDSQQLTMVDEVVGTPEYMAPEAIEHRKVDGRADLYALGVCAFELLTGATPFHEGGVLRVVQDHLKTPPPDLAALRPDAPPGLVAQVARLLDKDPAGRPATAAEAAAALEPFAAAEPPHRPAPEVRLTGARMPSWEDLFLVRLLEKHGVYPLETLLGGLAAWRRERDPAPFVVFLTRRAGLPVEAARRAHRAARQALINLRNRVATAQLRAAERVAPGRLDALALGPGAQLPAHLAAEGVLSGEEADALDRAVNRNLRQASDRILERVCRERGHEPRALSALEAELEEEEFLAVLQGVVRGIVEQL